MILDQTQHLALYRGLHPGMDTVIDYLAYTDLTALEPGKYDIDGDRICLVIQRPALRADGHWERHREHIDIQIALSGGETIGWAPVDAVSGWGEYNLLIDRTESPAPGHGTPLRMQRGCFAVFFPQDAHKTRLGTGIIHKAVFKIRM